LAGVDGGESTGQVCDKLVRAGKTDLGIANSKRRHALQEQHGIRHRDFEVGLLQAVAKLVSKSSIWGVVLSFIASCGLMNRPGVVRENRSLTSYRVRTVS